MGKWQLLWVSVFTPSSLCRSLGKVTGLAALLPVASHCWNLRLEPVILSRLSCLVEDKLQDLPQSTLEKKNVSDVGSVLKQDFQDDMAIILHMVSSQVASNIPQVCWIVLMARTLVMMAKLMPQVSACAKDRDEDLASDPTQRMETGSEIASSKNLHVLWSKLRHLYH